MDKAVYILCLLTSASVAVLLFRAYVRSRAGILFWSAMGFVGLALNNLTLVIDALVFPEVDLSFVRTIPAVVGMLLMIFGLVWSRE